MKSFRQYIAEEKKDCEKIFQKYVFGLVQGKSEEDTIPEDRIWELVSDYISSNVKSAAVQKAFIQLRDCKGSYPELVPDAKPIYRGISVKPSSLLRWLKGKKITNEISLRGEGISFTSVPIRYVGSEKNKIESFSVVRKTAMQFAQDNSLGFFNEREGKRARKEMERLVSEYKVLLRDKDNYDKEDVKYTLVEIQDYFKSIVDELFGGGFIGVDIPIMFEIPVPDKNCVLNPSFSNKIANHLLGFREGEITRINDGKSVDAVIYFPVDFMNSIKLVKELKAYIESQIPKIKLKELPI